VAATGVAATVLAATALAVLGSPGVADAEDAFTPGAPGVGDPYFPLDGNGGYDVGHYDLALRYDPLPGSLAGVATITATATQNLSRFDLDFVGLTVRGITVNGSKATWTRSGQELVIAPATGLPRNKQFTVVVTYDGIVDPLLSGSDASGFARTLTGAAFAGEPHGASSWFPVNEHPLDRATYTVHADVPAGLTAISNGALVGQQTTGGRTVWTWDARDPRASYLSLLAVGDYDLTAYRKNGVRYWDAVDRLLGPGYAKNALSAQPRVLDVLGRLFGRYPFDIAGGVVPAAGIGFALETQTRPVYSPKFFTDGGGEGVIVHELAHQWFGDDLPLASWRNIWLNEGFASYAQWLYAEKTGGASADAAFAQAWADTEGDDAFWSVKIGDPTPQNLFSGAVYTRGAMTLHQLRRVVGDAAFFTLLKTWVARHAGTNVRIEQFIATAEKVSGKDLTAFFDTWLFTGARPTLPGPGGPAAPA
jgi:aminopeptidase N